MYIHFKWGLWHFLIRSLNGEIGTASKLLLVKWVHEWFGRGHGRVGQLQLKGWSIHRRHRDGEQNFLRNSILRSKASWSKSSTLNFVSSLLKGSSLILSSKVIWNPGSILMVFEIKPGSFFTFRTCIFSIVYDEITVAVKLSRGII